MAKKVRGSATTGGAYRFKVKDPIIDKVRTVVADVNGGATLHSSQLRKIERDGGASVNCMLAWFTGKTRRPQNATVEASLRAMGRERIIVEMKGRRNGRA